MKVYERSQGSIIRVGFGNHISMSFKETTLEEVWDVVVKVFKNTKITSVIEVKDHCPFDTPQKSIGLRLSVRYEGATHGSRYKGQGKYKTLYGLTDKEAMKIFQENYEKYLQK